MKENLSDKIYKIIVDEIVAGRINQETVITERFLVDKFKISKSPIREALIKLSVDNIIYSIPRFGYKINLFDKNYLDSILKFRLNIEPKYLELYFDKISEYDLATIEANIVKMDKRAFATPMEYWRKTSAFHVELARSYKDKFFYEMLKNILNKQLITFSLLYWDDWSNILDKKLRNNHIGVLNEIKNKNKEKAIELLKADIQSF